MRKKLLLTAAMFLAFTGVVSASSINGEYNGNPIVKLKSNGLIIDTGEVPAMIYDGKTMVPIAALRNLGANVTWDPNTYSVDVKLPQSSTSNADEKLLLSKQNIAIAIMYKQTEDLAEELVQYNDFLSLYFNYHNSNFDTSYFDREITTRLPDISNHYNNIQNKFNDLSKILVGTNLSDLQKNINDIYQAIEYYKNATLDLIQWGTYKYQNNISNSQQSFNSYQNNAKSGFTLANNSVVNCSTGFNTYIYKIAQ